MVDYIEKHGGFVTGSTNLATHVLGDPSLLKAQQAVDNGTAIVVDEDFMRHVVKEFNSHGDSAGSQALVPLSQLDGTAKKKRKYKIERIVRKKIYKGQTFFQVQYVGLGDAEDELLSQEEVINRGGEKVLRSFLSQYKKEMKQMKFSNFVALQDETTDSPKKKSEEEKNCRTR
eukprot:TRINITY_DN9043_c0_g1_i6.p1 TRINITY_DN9043_c0_g1~~TRINITY_DN9043_c0_g1_i6.p1  ORF type:complete len:173 (-),score=42.34 TRINITY_DN9043_c0_g1_i6:470-988(-)